MKQSIRWIKPKEKTINMINYNSIYQRLPMINAAKAGQTITFEFGVWNSFPKSFMDLNFDWYGPAKMAELYGA